MREGEEEVEEVHGQEEVHGEEQTHMKMLGVSCQRKGP